MSISGNVAMAILRRIQPGKGYYGNVEKSRRKARKENDAFVFTYPKTRKAELSLLPGAQKPCLIIRPHNRKNIDKAILYIYGGVSNQWHTQKGMAIRYAIDTGTEVWYPVYPSMTEVAVSESIAYLTQIYQRMTQQYQPKKIILSGVSMGGYYALQILNNINHNTLDLPKPGLILAHSPGGLPDREHDWALMRQYEKDDPLFAEEDLRVMEKITPPNPPVPEWMWYPALGDFREAPPTYLYYGQEMLAGNASLYQRAFERSGSLEQLHIRITKNMMHGYSCLPVFPESRKSYNETLKWIENL